MRRPIWVVQFAQLLGVAGCLQACGKPSEASYYLIYESRATGTVTHETVDGVETWEVGARGEGTPCVFTHELVDGSGPFNIGCDEIFRFSEVGADVVLNDDQSISSAPVVLEGQHVPLMTADLTITESVGEIIERTYFVPADYVRRYTVSGELDCDADPELGCEGIWSLDLVGEQTKADIIFEPGEP